jgi:GR25 family glycosyltransferase involved in LPS biosynthesis
MRNDLRKYTLPLLGIALVCIVTYVSLSQNIIELFESNIPVEYYVISMKVPERLKSIEEQQRKMTSTLTIFDAVNGDHLDMNNVKDQLVADAFKADTKHRKREIGCFLSHYYIYKKIESKNQPDGYTVIMEDDVQIAVDDFENKIQTTLKTMEGTHDFDILYIENVSNNMGEKLLDNVCNMDKNKEMYGTQAYIVKNKNIGRILENTWLIDMPIDWKFITAIKSDKLRAYTFCPFLTKQAGFGTTIDLK